RAELAGSHFELVTKPRAESPAGAGAAATADTALAPRIFATLHAAIRQGLGRSCHDLREGGLAVALAAMACAGPSSAAVTMAPGGPLRRVQVTTQHLSVMQQSQKDHTDEDPELQARRDGPARRHRPQRAAQLKRTRALAQRKEGRNEAEEVKHGAEEDPAGRR